MASNQIIVNRMFNYCNFLIGFIFFNRVGTRAADGFYINHTEYSELIQKRIGSNITLQCNLKGLVENTKTADITYFWYFKQCGESSGDILNCYSYDRNDNEDWTQLPCQDNVCKSKLHLKNVTEIYSGLYKCTVMPKIGQILDVKLVRTFQLDIKNPSSTIPEFLDAYPLNKTISRGTQVVFQCRVYSEAYPSIKWFRRLPHIKYSSYENINSIVYYNGHAYELLTSTREKPTSRHVYLSKLIINDVQPLDEGCYACVAISFRGHNIREAFLKVDMPDNDFMEYWSDYSDEDELLHTDPKQFLLLFLMPVGLALLPLSVWLCYVIHKRYPNCSFEIDSKYLEKNDQTCMLQT